MTETTMAPAAVSIDPSEGLDEHASEVLIAPMAWPATAAATLGSRSSLASDDVRAEIEYVVTMRQLGQQFDASHSRLAAGSLIARLAFAVSLVTTITVCGLLLFIVALLDVPLQPNPYIAFALLLVGLALSGTVATAVHGELPRLRRR